MSTVLKLNLLLLAESKIRFVHQRRALQGVIRALPLQVAVGQAVQFLIDQRRQIAQCFLIAGSPLCQQFADQRR